MDLSSSFIAKKITESISDVSQPLSQIETLKQKLIDEEIKRDIYIIVNLFSQYPNLKSFHYYITYTNSQASFFFPKDNITLHHSDNYLAKSLSETILNHLNSFDDLASSLLFSSFQGANITIEDFDMIFKEKMDEVYYSRFEKEILEQNVKGKSVTHKVKI
jgi:hypothetical protein